PVIPGSIGATTAGAITTLGRGSSDYSAVALGAGLQATRVELIKADVDGLYSSDPRANEAAQFFPILTHQEALGLAKAGAKPFNSKAALLASAHAVPVWVRPAFSDG